MRIESALYTAREGLKAHGDAVSTTSNNIANINTTAYKSERVIFSEQYNEGADGRQSSAEPSAGNGVAVTRILENPQSGPIEDTGRDLDMAIAGNGYFLLKDENDTQYFSRAGNFRLNEEGLLTSDQGYIVQGFAGTSTDLTSLNLLNPTINVTPSSKITLSGNLASKAEIGTAPSNPATFAEIGAAASFTSQVSAIDSLGESHDIYVAFTKTDSNTWVAQAYINAGDAGGTEGTPLQLGQDATLTFNSTGTIEDANKAAAIITGTPAYSNGAAAGNFTIDLGAFSQLASISNVRAITNDGTGVGSITGYAISNTGEISAILDSGIQSTIGTIALTSLANVSGLQKIGGSIYQSGGDTGTQKTGKPNADGLGTINGKALERSNVDVADEFVSLVSYQLGYNASSRMVSVANEMIRKAQEL